MKKTIRASVILFLLAAVWLGGGAVALGITPPPPSGPLPTPFRAPAPMQPPPDIVLDDAQIRWTPRTGVYSYALYINGIRESSPGSSTPDAATWFLGFEIAEAPPPPPGTWVREKTPRVRYPR